MELKEVQISEIKDLNLIHVFAVDNVSEKDSNKYVVAKVVYGGNKKLSLDYRDKHFQDFIKKIIERYNKEKDKRKIILLGELTEKLMNDSSFAILKQDLQKGNQTRGLMSFNTSVNEINKVDTYLKEAIKMIILLYKKYDVLNVDKIDGFGNKYIASYSISSVKKQLPIIIVKREDGIIDFRISRIDDINTPINGTVTVDSGRVDVVWQSEDEVLKGKIIYDANKNIIERKITAKGRSICYDENRQTLLEEDVETILFYSGLCNLGENNFNILKTGNNAYLLGIESTFSDEKNGIIETGLSKNLQLQEEKVLFERKGIQIDLKENEARVRFSSKNSLSKYKDSLTSVLTEELEEITFRKVEIDYKPCVLMEKKYKNSVEKLSFSYEVFELDEDVDLRKPFSFVKRYPIDKEVKTLESVKQYIREHKGVIL